MFEMNSFLGLSHSEEDKPLVTAQSPQSPPGVSSRKPTSHTLTQNSCLWWGVNQIWGKWNEIHAHINILSHCKSAPASKLCAVSLLYFPALQPHWLKSYSIKILLVINWVGGFFMAHSVLCSSSSSLSFFLSPVHAEGNAELWKLSEGWNGGWSEGGMEWRGRVRERGRCKNWENR